MSCCGVYHHASGMAKRPWGEHEASRLDSPIPRPASLPCRELKRRLFAPQRCEPRRPETMRDTESRDDRSFVCLFRQRPDSYHESWQLRRSPVKGNPPAIGTARFHWLVAVFDRPLGCAFQARRRHAGIVLARPAIREDGGCGAGSLPRADDIDVVSVVYRRREARSTIGVRCVDFVRPASTISTLGLDEPPKHFSRSSRTICSSGG